MHITNYTRLFASIRSLKLKFRIESHTIRALQRPLPSIPEKRTQLEPLLATAMHMDRALMTKVNVFLNR